MGNINVAIVGVGNCASALVQGVTKYGEVTSNKPIPGLMHPVLGEYGIGDINFVAAFDVDATKVGLDMSEAIFATDLVAPTPTEMVSARSSLT